MTVELPLEPRRQNTKSDKAFP